jgi:acetyl esterase/lipase
MPAQTYEFTTRDVEYLRHGDRRFMARLFIPQGQGPFPAIVELHGGAWCNGDLNECKTYAEALARNGLAVAALDFRHAGDGYPTSLADINYGIRWVKANAGELNTRADLIGAAGQSSGGHLAMLAAMRPNDPRYAAIKLPSSAPAVDASLRAVAMLWPVINPLSRYRHALRARDSANPPAWVGNIPDRHARKCRPRRRFGCKAGLTPCTTITTPIPASPVPNPSASPPTTARRAAPST